MRFWVCFCVIWSVIAVSATAETVTSLSYRTGSDWTDVTITRTQSHQKAPKIFQISGDSPRVVVDWNDADPVFQAAPGQGHVSGVRYARHGQRGLRLVLDLHSGSALATHNIVGDHITLRVSGPALQVASATQVNLGFVPTPRLQPRKQARLKAKKVIVIDPGHGGRDPGAIGKKGTYEKSITLNAALKLRDMLLQTGRYDVIMTRGDDRYIKHDDRLRLARSKNADLFISIHADSTKSSTARGASVYTLADRAQGRSRKVVDNQNWIMDIDLSTQSDPVGDILVDLAQRKTLSQSTMFADILIDELSGTTKLLGNTHRRAGYYVLLAPDVPAVLLELGFLSNPNDETLLRSATHRKKLMRSVTTAINQYFDTQKP